MSARRSDSTDNLLLIAATAIFVLTLQRYLEAGAPLRQAPDLVETPPAALAAEIAQHGRGRRSHNPLQILWAGWKDILWRTYARTGDDRLLATAAGVV